MTRKWKPRTAWAAIYRRGGAVCAIFQHLDSAKAFVGEGRVLRVAKVRITEIVAKKRSKR